MQLACVRQPACLSKLFSAQQLNIELKVPDQPPVPFITAKEEEGDPGILCFTNYFDTSDFEG